ncbi:lytic murein transglycosylase [Conexibacter arvalis]|uniref:lytic murein transglycosylase n=1 Tax=Conexibacter arvalis TaxID=912552 RepID=UPI001C85A5D0
MNLLGGKQVTLTVDVPPGTTIDKSILPDLGLPVVSIVDLGSVEPPAVTAPQTQAQTQTAPPSTITTTPTVPTAPSTTTTPPSTGTTTGPTPPTGTGTTGTTPTTTQPSAVGGVVKPRGKGKGKAKGEGSAQAVRGRRGAANDDPALTDANRDGTATRGETPDTPPQTDGAQPTPDTPGFTVAPTLDAPSGVPNFFIEQFRIPPFLLPIYQAAGMQYGVPWQILAAINEIETDYGRNLSVSSAGALGWMQFMPSSWEAYGVDANGDGIKDPYNPVDAIFAAGRYLKAAGAETDLPKAIFAYNHADWYVESVLLRARVIGGMPADLVGSLTGLTQGRFPVAARATYANSIDTRSATRRVAGSNAAVTVEGDAERRSINIYARRGAPVVAVNDGTIVKLGENEQLGRFVVLQDVYGNRYTYSHLGSVAAKHPVLKERDQQPAGSDIEQPRRDAAPTQPASDGTRQAATGEARGRARRSAARGGSAGHAEQRQSRAGTDAPAAPAVEKERLFANPSRPQAFAAGGQHQIQQMGERLTTFDGYFTGPLELDPDDYVLKPLAKGSTVIAGTVLGRIDKTDERLAPHVEFQIRPAGRGAPRIDPKPILDGWKLLESTAIYKAGNENALFGSDGRGSPSIGQILLMSKEQLMARVLANPNVEIYQCGRDDIRAGIVDRRVLATIEFLAASGLKPTISSLQCGHGYFTSSGNVSEHSSGSAMDIAAINGITITPSTQGEGSITDMTIRRLLTLQGTMKPHQIISLMTYPDADNTLALPDHGDHIHVGFHAAGEDGELPRIRNLMRPDQWPKLMRQLSGIQNPVVPLRPSRYAIRDRDGE